MKHRLLIAIACLLRFQASHADASLEYRYAESAGQSPKTQSVKIKDGKIKIQSVGGGGQLDFVYSVQPEILLMVDHGKHQITTLDNQQLDRIGQQTETVQPLLQGFGQQLSKLDPVQRKKWEQLLGGKVPLDALAETSKPLPEVSLVKSGKARKIANIPCEPMTVWTGKAKTAELCLAEPGKLNLSSQDYQAIRSLLAFLHKATGKTQQLAALFGVRIPAADLGNATGVPIEFKELAGQARFTLASVSTATVAEDLAKMPEGYQYGPFKLWD